MLVTLYMATSLNGYINDAEGRTPWCDAEWDRYSRVLADSKSLIVGRKTHEIMEHHGEYTRLGIERVIVITSKDVQQNSRVVTATSPKDALNILAKEGFDKTIVGGGAATNAAFLNQDLVQEICIDLEPFLFISGQPLFEGSIPHNINLELIDVDRYDPNALGLRYKVL